MPHSPTRLSRFWQELKRRKVIRVITVYAAAAFVIMEMVSIVAVSLKLPEWTLVLQEINRNRDSDLEQSHAFEINVEWLNPASAISAACGEEL